MQIAPMTGCRSCVCLSICFVANSPLFRLRKTSALMNKLFPSKDTTASSSVFLKKPHKWGYKVFVLCGVSGYAYDMEVYSGKQDNLLREGEMDCGASGNVVVRLSRCIPDNENFKVFFDNYFNSPDLQATLAKRGILSVGTVRTNKLPNFPLPSDAELKKHGRGAHAEKVAFAGNVKMSVVRWFDNRPVTLCQLLCAPSLWEMSGDGTKPRKKKYSFHAHKLFQSTTNTWAVLICLINLLGSIGAKFVQRNCTTESSRPHCCHFVSAVQCQ